MDCQANKSALRHYYSSKRAGILRRQEAEMKALRHLQALARHKVLSYSSFGSELSTVQLNEWLANQGFLVLPKVQNDDLVLYEVENLSAQLGRGFKGIWEPIPALCRPAKDISLILVPGLAFDANKQRLGYGGGYYDRLLARLKVPSIGIGFREQLSEQPLPTFETDIAVQDLLLI